jgi:hypothetical protein
MENSKEVLQKTKIDEMDRMIHYPTVGYIIQKRNQHVVEIPAHKYLLWYNSQ